MPTNLCLLLLLSFILVSDTTDCKYWEPDPGSNDYEYFLSMQENLKDSELVTITDIKIKIHFVNFRLDLDETDYTHKLMMIYLLVAVRMMITCMRRYTSKTPTRNQTRMI